MRINDTRYDFGLSLVPCPDSLNWIYGPRPVMRLFVPGASSPTFISVGSPRPGPGPRGCDAKLTIPSSLGLTSSKAVTHWDKVLRLRHIVQIMEHTYDLEERDNFYCIYGPRPVNGNGWLSVPCAASPTFEIVFSLPIEAFPYALHPLTL